MSTLALSVCAGLYVLTAWDLYSDKQYGLALAFLCYAAANVGLLMAAKKI